MTIEQYQMNPNKVVSNIIDGEALLINLETGTYYNLNPGASVIWQLLVSGAPVDQIVSRMVEQAPETTDPAADIKGLIEELLGAGLLEPRTQPAEAGEDMFETVIPGEIIYQKPVVEVYNDLQGLLLVDPIHEVEDAGWPHIKSDQ